METKRSIVWFKSDLRISDNEALAKAVKESEEIIPIYIFDEADYLETAFGTKRTGSFRFQFLLESLTDLNEQLISIGSKLVVLKTKPKKHYTKSKGHQQQYSRIFV
jgi:deoxyribodipyrimidine photo-lyase